LKKPSNNRYHYVWKGYRSFKTPSQAKQISIRLEMIRGLTTKVEYDNYTKEYCVLILSKKTEEKINKDLNSYE